MQAGSAVLWVTYFGCCVRWTFNLFLSHSSLVFSSVSYFICVTLIHFASLLFILLPFFSFHPSLLTIHSPIFFILFNCISPHLTSPHLTVPHLTSPLLHPPHYSSPHLTSPHVASPHLTSLHFTSPHFTSPHCTFVPNFIPILRKIYKRKPKTSLNSDNRENMLKFQCFYQ